jgi:DNA topoisomerase-2
MTHLDKDIISIMYKRVYDLAGVTPADVRVKLNGKSVDVKNFMTYVDLYLKCEDTKLLPKIIEKGDHDRWEVVASLSDG